MNNPFITGILHLEDLPEQEVYLRLEENYKNSFLDSAKSLCDGKWTSLGRILNLPISHNNVEILRCFRRTNIYSLKLIKKISKFLIENGFKEYSLDKLEKKIILIKSKQGSPKGILNPKFPINFNSKESHNYIPLLNVYTIQKLDEKIKASNFPPDLLEKIEGMINLLQATLKSGNASFINFETVSNYVNWIISLPFNKETKDILDLNHAKEILDKNHYGLLSVKNRILEYLSSIILTI